MIVRPPLTRGLPGSPKTLLPRASMADSLIGALNGELAVLGVDFLGGATGASFDPAQPMVD